MPYAKPADNAAIRATLSAARADTYLAACGGDGDAALELYGWNARISAALMLPAHFTEVSVRNAVDEALTAVYGALWPWHQGFFFSLPQPRGPVYKPRKDLESNRNRYSTTGKVVADLKFVFWQAMFTARHDERVWNDHLLAVFPNATGVTVAELRFRVYDDLEVIRRLRNRLAHHEPIFTRDVADDLRRMLELTQLRSGPTASWVQSMEDVSALLAEKP